MNDIEFLQWQLDLANDDLENMRNIALFLFDKLDDVDTYGDMCKNDYKAYHDLALKAASKRFKAGIVAGSSGERVEWVVDFNGKD